MTLSPEELAQEKRYEDVYVRSQLPVMIAIERRVCGCDFGGSSWTTRDQAERIGDFLELRPGRRLLDVGAGSGWPSLHLAAISGCDVVLVDLPHSGLRIAAERAIKDRIRGSCWVAVADGAHLPFIDGGFDAVLHSDVLCCLRNKRAVLTACRRVVRDTGIMAFSVISISPGLSRDSYRRALQAGPEFVESNADYSALLKQTGWQVIDRRDATHEFEASCGRQLRADEDFKEVLQPVIGAEAAAERIADWHCKIMALGEGLLRREFYVAKPN